ncbi:carbonic anhydrase 14-like isoform X2 [Tenebrio molitor]|uniref:carbonic anhydrase 14-like isoform X2 n=1 Tax=Tenebrio molitor TaxID=7067 RepID=UPI0036248930
MQSPITIDQGNVITRNYTPFHFAGYNQTYNAQITYSDHSISINFLMDSRLPSVSGGGLFKEYVLTALDFHWDSEHVINEHKFPLEGQFVHYAKKYANLAEALNYRDGVTILSTLYNLSKKSNDVFDNLIETIPRVRMKIDHPVELLQPIIPRHFLTPKIEKFYRYNGSLTTPCFEESAIWTVFSVPSSISDSQLEGLTETWKCLNKGHKESCRAPQDTNGRRIYLSAI